MDNKRLGLRLEPGRCLIRDRPAQGVAIRFITWNNIVAVTAGYVVLPQWSVDCSPDRSLRGRKSRLLLKDQLAQYGVNDVVKGER
jgi:hypothetical protein